MIFFPVAFIALILSLGSGPHSVHADDQKPEGAQVDDKKTEGQADDDIWNDPEVLEGMKELGSSERRELIDVVKTLEERIAGESKRQAEEDKKPDQQQKADTTETDKAKEAHKKAEKANLEEIKKDAKAFIKANLEIRRKFGKFVIRPGAKNLIKEGNLTALKNLLKLIILLKDTKEGGSLHDEMVKAMVKVLGISEADARSNVDYITDCRTCDIFNLELIRD